jgi:hypothetical protein
MSTLDGISRAKFDGALDVAAHIRWTMPNRDFSPLDLVDITMDLRREKQLTPGKLTRDNILAAIARVDAASANAGAAPGAAAAADRKSGESNGKMGKGEAANPKPETEGNNSSQTAGGACASVSAGSVCGKRKRSKAG